MCRPNAVGGLGFLPEALMLVFLGALSAGLPATTLLILVAALVLVAGRSPPCCATRRSGRPAGLPMPRCPGSRWPICAAATMPA